MLEIIAAYWLSCASGDLEHCAPDQFATEGECYATADGWAYGLDGVCLYFVIYQYAEEREHAAQGF